MSDLDDTNRLLTDALSLGERDLRERDPVERDLGAKRPGGKDDQDVPSARMLANIKRRVSSPAPAGTFTVKPRQSEWEAFDRGIDRQRLVEHAADGTETVLYRLQPAATFAAHGHSEQETCWVIQGEILVGDHLVQAGEMHVAEAGCDHPEITARTEALLLIRSQAYAPR